MKSVEKIRRREKVLSSLGGECKRRRSKENLKERKDF
jgi:hypothetical protein